MAAFDFPAGPALNQTYTPAGGPTYVWNGVAWAIAGGPVALALRAARNRIVNGAMQISQENGDTASAIATMGFYHSADEWRSDWSLTGTASTLRGSGSPSGSNNINITIGTATASPAAGAYLQLGQRIEGTRIKDFLWGTAQAKPVILRFTALITVAGTYSLSITNAASNRTYLAPFTASAGSWNTYTLSVPGDTTGTWPTTTAHAMTVGFGFASGTTYGGGTAGWQAGTKIQIAGNTNLAATAGAAVLLADVGLYLDDQNTGIAPRWEMPDAAQELEACRRYYQTGGHIILSDGYATGTENCHWTVPVAPVMRTTPASSFGGLFYVNGSGLSDYGSSPSNFSFYVVATANGRVYVDFIYTLNARM